MTWKIFIFDFIFYGFLLYSISIILVYSWIGWYGRKANKKYIKKNSLTDYSLIASSQNAPGFSLIAPAYNEAATIVDNIRSLLSLYYTNLEIIVVNDGSKDNSIELLIDAYDLKLVDYLVEGNLKTKEIRGIYKSTNPVFKKLIIVDKENGGKSDALNVGINISTKDYIVCIDVDCILEQDSILKLAKPFIDDHESKVIACGGVIRLANNCEIVNGKITKVNLPKTLLGKSQALEYIRAFILGRMAWSHFNGLILISGAFGAFDRKIVLAVGGYDHETVGEDMELVVRMRRYMYEQKIKHKVVNIPNPLCWTEVPEDKSILNKQRNRWMRGTIETLYKHRILFFNPKYGKLGLISYPYWFFFEFLGPIVEFFGFIVFFIFLFLGIINWPIFYALLAFVLLYGVLYSIYAISVDTSSYNVYYKRKDVPRLILVAFSEPFYFHPKVVLSGVKGVRDYFFKNNSWGEMTRQGFNTQDKKELTFLEKLKLGFVALLQNTTAISLTYLILSILSTVGEFYLFKSKIPPADSSVFMTELLTRNFLFSAKIIFIVSFIYYILQYINQSWANFIPKFVYPTLIISNLLLVNYFNTTLNLLGSDLFSYSLKEIVLIIGASGVLNAVTLVVGTLAIAIIVSLILYLGKFKINNKFAQYPLLIICFISLFINVDNVKVFYQTDEFENNLTESKSNFFYSNAFAHLVIEPIQEMDIFNFNGSGSDTDNRKYIDPENYPFLYQDDSENYLATQLNQSTNPPNIVFIVVEGLGRAYSNQEAYLGSFTPFIDELSKKSLYWENGLSSAGRTFGALPSITGSLPFGKSGFMELPEMPKHFNLINLLNNNNYQTGFFYGGDSEFDNMKKYLTYSQVKTIVDQNSYDSSFKKIPSKTGFSWGYDDHSVLQNYFNYVNNDGKPYFNIVLTLATHSPFLINDEAKYKQKFNGIIKGLDSEKATQAKKYEKELITFLSLDDAVKDFFETYKKRADFNNTIFVITGDHRVPEIPMNTKIDRFHVPIMVYSPLLKQPAKMSNLVSHFDLAPTFATLLRDTYQLNIPNQVTWLGKNLSNGKGNYRSIGTPLMQNKNALHDYVYKDYHLVDGKLFKISKNLNEDPIQDAAIEDELNIMFNTFKKKNNSLLEKKNIVPDSLLNKYLK